MKTFKQYLKEVMVYCQEMARPKKMIPNNTSTNVLDAEGLVNTIGKTRANKIFNHPYHKKHIIDGYPHKVGYKVTTDKDGFPTVSASSSFTFTHKGRSIRKMVQYPMSKITDRIYNAHVFNNYDDERHHDGGPVWHYQSSYKSDEK